MSFTTTYVHIIIFACSVHNNNLSWNISSKYLKKPELFCITVWIHLMSQHWNIHFLVSSINGYEIRSFKFTQKLLKYVLWTQWQWILKVKWFIVNCESNTESMNSQLILFFVLLLLIFRIFGIFNLKKCILSQSV